MRTERRPKVGRRLNAALVAALLAIATGCTPPDAETEPRGDDPSPSPAVAPVKIPPLRPGQRYVVDPWHQNLVAYDPVAGTVARRSDQPGYFYYNFRSPSPLLTAGHNEANEFVVLAIDGLSTRQILQTGPDQALFPLAADEKHTFFVSYEYKDGGREERRRQILRLGDEGTLEPYASVTGPRLKLDRGAILGERLFYTTYDATTDEYSLFSIPVEKPGETPRLEQEHLPSGEVLVDDGELFLSDGQKISSPTRSFTCADLCWFYDSPHVLVTMAQGSGGDVTLSVHDSTSGSALGSVDGGVVGFDVADDIITVYTQHGVRSLDVSKVSK